MADYSEFPTTPTAWQERALQDMMPVAVETAPTPPARRGVDLTALVPGLVFVVLAVFGLAGAALPLGLFEDGGILWLVLVLAGVWLLFSELRRSRRRH
ncbi:hypothetical protein [Blastococcus sp. SYSU D00820]